MGGEVYLKDLDDIPKSSRINKFDLNKPLTDSELMKFNSDNDIDISEVDFRISTDESICNDNDIENIIKD